MFSTLNEIISKFTSLDESWQTKLQSRKGDTFFNLEKLNPTLESWYKDNRKKSMHFASELKEIIKKGGLAIVYDGTINQEVVKGIFSSIEKKLDESRENTKTKKQIFHVIVGLLQNISKYSNSTLKGKGSIMVGKNHEKYYVIARNEISHIDIPHLTYILDFVNQQFDVNRLNEFYENKISNGKYDGHGGAGLALLDIVRKSKQKIEYFIEPFDKNNSVFYIKATVLRETNSITSL